MTIEQLTIFLGTLSVINLALFVWWLLLILVANQWVYRMHNRFFSISKAQFDTIHYSGMLFYKILILFFNVLPWVVLKLLA